MSLPDLGAKRVFAELALRRALESAIGRGVSVHLIAERLETSAASVERWRDGNKLPHPDYCEAVTNVLNKM